MSDPQNNGMVYTCNIASFEHAEVTFINKRNLHKEWLHKDVFGNLQSCLLLRVYDRQIKNYKYKACSCDRSSLLSLLIISDDLESS
jgi:hypothetical protein